MTNRHLVILDLGELIPAMSSLAATYRRNLLAAEAVVAADVLGADIEVGIDTPQIGEVAAARRIVYVTV